MSTRYDRQNECRTAPEPQEMPSNAELTQCARETVLRWLTLIVRLHLAQCRQDAQMRIVSLLDSMTEQWLEAYALRQTELRLQLFQLTQRTLRIDEIILQDGDSTRRAALLGLICKDQQDYERAGAICKKILAVLQTAQEQLVEHFLCLAQLAAKWGQSKKLDLALVLEDSLLRQVFFLLPRLVFENDQDGFERLVRELPSNNEWQRAVADVSGRFTRRLNNVLRAANRDLERRAVAVGHQLKTDLKALKPELDSLRAYRIGDALNN